MPYYIKRRGELQNAASQKNNNQALNYLIRNFKHFEIKQIDRCYAAFGHAQKQIQKGKFQIFIITI